MATRKEIYGRAGVHFGGDPAYNEMILIPHAPKNDGARSLRAIVVGAISLSCEKSLAAEFVEGPECHGERVVISLLQCSSLHSLNDTDTRTTNQGICTVPTMYYVTMYVMYEHYEMPSQTIRIRYRIMSILMAQGYAACIRFPISEMCVNALVKERVKLTHTNPIIIH